MTFKQEKTRDEHYRPVVLDMVLHVVEAYTLAESDVIRTRLHRGSPVYI